MSTSLLYHAFGVRDYLYLKTEYIEGGVIFTVERKAEACDFTGGSFAEYGGRLHKWDDHERAELMAELDAAYFHLYGIDRDDAEYILSTFQGIHTDRPLLSGSQSTAELVLAKYDELAANSN